MTRDNNKKTHYVVLGGKGGGQAESVEWDDIQNKPEFATVATSGSYNDLTDKPEIPAAQVNSDWNATSGVAQILNKPTLATVATTGSYNDLTDKPTVTQEQADWNQTDTTADDYIKNKPEIPSVPAMETETLTFTLQGGTTKTIDFYVVPNYFYVEDISGSDNTLSIKKQSDSAPDVEVFYSTDKINWASMGTTTTTGITATVPANGKLYLKTTTDNWGNASGYNAINCTNNFNVGGNIMSLIYSDNFVGKTVFPTNKGYVFYNLFSNSVIVSAGNLLLPATTVPDNGYTTMFNGCTSLTTAPAVLPATSVGSYGYNSMLNGCTSLTTAPEIYCNNFGTRACRSMFANCTNLNKIVTYNTKLGIQSHADWLYNASATGDFYNLGGATYSSGTSGIPTGWTKHTSL